MLTQLERIKIREVIEKKIVTCNTAILQWENARSVDSFMLIPGYEKKDADTIVRHQKIKIALLQQALSAVNQEWYGTCNRCGRPISTNQLMEAPELTKCHNCLK